MIEREPGNQHREGDDAAREHYFFVHGNPYARLSIDDQPEDDCLAVPSPEGPRAEPRTPVALAAAHPRPGITRAQFLAGCRTILGQYEPLKGKRIALRPEFAAFIAENQKKSPLTRAAILADLRRFDLGPGLRIHLNREEVASIVSKLRLITDSYQD